MHYVSATHFTARTEAQQKKKAKFGGREALQRPLVTGRQRTHITTHSLHLYLFLYFEATSQQKTQREIATRLRGE
jgi:hypothetical protein